MKRIVLFLLILYSHSAFAQWLFKGHPFSTQSEEGFLPCRDTFSIFKAHHYYDLNLMLPSWLPVVDKNYVGVVEGKVAYNLADGTDGPHIAHEDLPFYHYSHDMDFDVVPDKTPDGRFTNMLSCQVYAKPTESDTILCNTIHCEWECGLGMANRINPLRDNNDMGRSGGFASGGHELGNLIWNWTTTGDWVHVEGNYIWDRGHPPAETEIHPVRFLAIKRALPERIIIGDSLLRFSTRVDIFASGDGGALMNNRYNSPNFVKRVNMSSKDYEFDIKVDLPRPSTNAHLKYTLTRHKGDDFSYYETIDLNDDSTSAHIAIPWKTKNANDLEIYARTINLYWDEGKGAPTDFPVDIYKVKFTHLHFRNLSEVLTKADIRLFANVGNDWIFLNDFFGKKGKILTKGLGKTRKHNWTLNNEFTVYVPRGKSFRVYMSGWENDGVDLLFGKLFDPGAPCNRKTKWAFKLATFSVKNMLLKGCLDDEYGEISKLHNYENLGKIDHFTNSPQNGINDDPCPGAKYPLKDRYFLTYTIEKIN